MKLGNLILVVSLSASMVFAGCSSMSTTTKSTVAGAAIGTGAGAVVGAGTGLAVAAIAGKNKKKAVVIGAAAGAVVGGTAGAIIGNKIGKKKQALQESLKNATVEEVTDQNDLAAIKVTFSEGALNFSTGKSTVGTTGQAELKTFASQIANEEFNVQVVGHTDNTGSLEANQKVSAARAEAVATILKNNGVPASRIASAGLDYQVPVADNSTAEGRAQNRRVEVFISADQAMIDAANNGTLK